MKNNIISKIFSFIFALFIWITVYNIYDPVITVQKSNIPIVFQNESALTEINKVYSINSENKNVSFYLKGKQSAIKSIKDSDIKVYADLSYLSDVNSVKINIELPRQITNNIEIIYGKYDTVKVNLDNLVTKTFDLDVLPLNELNKKYYLLDNNIDMEINVTGAQQLINKISKLYIEPNLKNYFPNYSLDYSIKAKDNFGSEIDLSQLVLEKQNINETKEIISSIKYSPTIYNTKEISLNINFIGDIPYGYQINTTDYIPKKVLITGTDEILKNTNSIDIDYDISGMTNSKSIKLKLLDLLENNDYYLTDETLEITLDLDIEQFSSKTYNLTNSDLNIKNMPEHMTITYLSNSSLKINIMGDKEHLNKISINDLNSYIDLKDLPLGQHIIPIKISNDNFKLINSDSISIELKETIEETIEETGTTTDINESSSEVN